jgi:hypothetical protein
MVVSLQNEDFIREAASDREFADHIIQSQRSEYRRLDSDESPNMVQFGIPLFNHEVCFGTLIVDYAATGQMDAEMMLGDLTEMSNRVRKNFLFSHFASAADDLRKHRLAQSVVDGIGKHIDTKPLAFEVVNRLQKYLKADRASLAFRKGHSYVMKGISNQAVFDRRSKVVRGQEQLAKKVAQTQNPLWYPAERNEMAPSIRELMDKYLESSNGVSVAFLPVFGEQKRRDDPEDIAATIKPEELRKEPIGVLVLESFEQPLDAARIRRRWARIAKPVCQSIDNARRFESILLMPVWRTLGHAADWYRGHTRRKAFLITGAIAGVIALLTLLPADFKLRGDGVIQPLQRQHVFAEIDGTVKRLFVDDGQVVERGDLLVDLKNPELATRMAETEGKYNESRQRLDTLTVQRITRAFENEEEERELVRNFSTTRARVEGLEKQLNLLKQSTDRLRINSPLAGSVVTWDTEQRLMDRPVKQGDY